MDRLANLLGVQALALTDRLMTAGPGSATELSGSERAAVVTLLAHPDRSVSWLGEVLGLTSSGITRLLDRLVAAGWVTRDKGLDARSRRVRLTRAGRARARAVLRARREVMSDVIRPLSADDRKELERLLDLVVSGLADTRGPALRACRLCDRAACASAGRECPLQHTVAVADADG